MAERISTSCVNAMMTTFINDFKNGVLAIYSGIQPNSADDAETGTLLCLITKDGNTFVPGQPGNGINFKPQPSSGVALKRDDEIWSGVVLEDGIAGWFRFYDNSYTRGASNTAKRFDGRIGTGTDAEMQITNTNVVKDGMITVASFPVVLPLSGV